MVYGEGEVGKEKGNDGMEKNFEGGGEVVDVGDDVIFIKKVNGEMWGVFCVGGVKWKLCGWVFGG